MDCSKPVSAITVKNLRHVFYVLWNVPQCSYSHVFQIPSHGALQERLLSSWYETSLFQVEAVQTCKPCLCLLAQPESTWEQALPEAHPVFPSGFLLLHAWFLKELGKSPDALKRRNRVAVALDRLKDTLLEIWEVFFFQLWNGNNNFLSQWRGNNYLLLALQ